MTDQSEAVGKILGRPPATTDAKAEQSSPRERMPLRFPSLSEQTRADNRSRDRASPMRNLEREFHCECARPDCRVRLPLEVERHRRSNERFIVGLAHADRDIVVGVADHFLVVEENGATRSSQRSVARRGQRTVQD